MAMIMVQTVLKLSWRNESSMPVLLQNLRGSSGTLSNSAAEDDIDLWVRITCLKCFKSYPDHSLKGMVRPGDGSSWALVKCY